MKYMTVTRHRALTATNRYGQEEPTGAFESFPQKALWAGRTSSTEMTANRDTLLDTARMALLPESDVKQADEYTVLGARWTVRGIMRQMNPTNPDKEWLVTVDLQRAE
jgi:hypothetical protein